MPINDMLDPTNTLEELNPVILHLARKSIPRKVLHPHIVDLEIDDLVQNTRIKLWQALQRGNIVTPIAYVRRIIYTEVVNIVRQHERTFPLDVDEASDGEQFQGNTLIATSEGMHDPSYEVELEESFADCVGKVVHSIKTLPSCQQYAMICSLKEQREETFPVLDALTTDMDIEAIQWPEHKADSARLRSSLCMARKKMRHQHGSQAKRAQS